jgi:hypothetical protein
MIHFARNALVHGSRALRKLYSREMRDKIAEYLKTAGRPLPAQEILRDALRIQAPNSSTADSLLKSILGSDPRFLRRRGLWRLVLQASPAPIKIAALVFQCNRSQPLFFRGAVHLAGIGSSWEFFRIEGSGTEHLTSLKEARHRAGDCLLAAWHKPELTGWNRLLRMAGLPEWHGDFLALNRLAGRMLPGSCCRNAEDLAPSLGLAPPDVESPAALARFISEALRSLLDLIPEEHRGSPAAIERWIDAGMAKVDFSRFAFDRDFLSRIPERPGVYLMRSRAGEVIYIGKSANLRRRVRSYFHARALSDGKVARIHSQLYSLEFFTCATEIEALLLEIRMIRDFHPLINLQEEVHEQPDRYGHGRNLLILVPVGNVVEVYFLKDGVFAARQSVPFATAPGKKLRGRIQSVFFGSGKKCWSRLKEPWECEIVSRWFSANRRQLNYVDIHESGSFEAVLGKLESYLNDPDRLSHKVYYR